MKYDYRVSTVYNIDDVQTVLDQLAAEGYSLHSIKPYSVFGREGGASEKFLVTMERIVHEEGDDEPEEQFSPMKVL